ncbi:MAG TPA: hypothetical protein VK843_15200 [Planctomycetota bacterium]|nr:hypothetical protein [Planctomycetota bacterium]
MKLSIPLGAAALALATIATSCTMFAGQSPHDGSVYLVGVDGGG